MKRLIALVLLRAGMVVRAERFQIYQKIGNPVYTVQRLSSWSVDELIILELLPGQPRDPYLDRKDIELSFVGDGLAGLLRHVSPWTFMPLTAGGGIHSVEEMRVLFDSGADKISINTAALEHPDLIDAGAREFGSQSIVVSIDAVGRDGSYKVASHGGQRIHDRTPEAWARECVSRGAGEILLNSVDRDGAGCGLDHGLIQRVVTSVDVPVIGAGGVGCPQDIVDGFRMGGLDAVAVANHFHFKENSYPIAKQGLVEAGIAVRHPQLNTKWSPREPCYDTKAKRRRVAARLWGARRGGEPDGSTPEICRPGEEPPIQFCRKCVVPSSSAVPVAFDAEGVCSACRGHQDMQEVNKAGHHEPSEKLREDILAARGRNYGDYDCIIAVSGGKDSHFQTYYVKEVLGLRPLLVTYYGNNFTAEGDANLRNLSKAFGVDHIIVRPGIETLRKLNWLGFVTMGDMNWHNHVGLATVPFQVAVEKKIPIVIYGEHGYADLGGQFSPRDMIEWTYRHRLEHFARGYEWTYMAGLAKIRPRDMAPFKYPSDTDIFEIGIRGIFLSNYTVWDGNMNAEVAKEFGFRSQKVPSKRTYRLISNLDDIHENGLHDYLRWIKFGYGRCTDHACKDIRAGRLTRKEGARLVRDHDHQLPDDLQRWLTYVGVRESTFHRIANTFRDRRVWAPTDTGWRKRNVWDEYDDL